MRHLFPFLTLCFFLLVPEIDGQIDARLFRYPDISSSHIAFVYGGDVWLVEKGGGTAVKVTATPGEESFPRFSPDGSQIAFSANYHGNTDIYVMGSGGGVPARITHHSMSDRMVDWHPDGDRILFVSRRESGRQAFGQFYSAPATGGMPDKLPIPYGELGSYSPDGEKLAYVTRITENFPFKRYRGGMASDVIIFDLETLKAQNITRNEATDGKPQWHGDRIYFVSDQGEEIRRNLYVYNVTDGSTEKITSFRDVDINHFSIGPAEAVFEAGGHLYVLSLGDHSYRQVDIDVISDRSTLLPRTENVGGMIRSFDISPDAKRAVFEARGELFSVPAEHGYLLNMTRSSGALDRNPAWSPDGKYIAYWSDESGENQIYLREVNTNEEARKMTNFGTGFGYQLFWSPDSDKIAFANEKQEIHILDIETGELTLADRTNRRTHSSLRGLQLNWSPDGNWITYAKAMDNFNGAIFLYELSTGTVHQVTSGYYNENSPIFDPDGKYLYLLTNRSLSPRYSSLDNTWIYPNSANVAVITLDPETDSPLKARNDEVEIEEEEKADRENGDEKAENGEADEENGDGEEEDEDISIVLEGLESRLEILPLDAGNFRGLDAAKGKVIYHRTPNTGSGDRNSPLAYYDLKEREEKVILGSAGAFVMTPDGKQMLVSNRGSYAIVKVAPQQKMEDPLRTGEMEMTVVPQEEWKQLFHDTWRRYRDLFYDPNMHQVDWDAMRKQYGDMIEDASTRLDVSNILVELISELSAGHTYAGGGDSERASSRATGYLGVDWSMENGAYRIERIVRGAPWDHDVRSPLDQAGNNIDEGDYILAVNGVPIDPARDPYAAFEGLSGKAVTLTVNDGPELDGAREVVLTTISMGEEARLRHLEWIEGNRQKVEELSGGRIGYVYMPNTGGQGQTELLRQYYGQLDKEGFVIDERFNAGGQLSDRFMELLERPTVFYLHWRHSKDHKWPIKSNEGPKAMLINGWSGSGGDAFPWAFKVLDAGPIIGERTVGILVGPATGHQLMDGGFITVPDARLYDISGDWFAEGYGVVPDIEVWDDPTQLAKGVDPQLQRGVEEILRMLEEDPPTFTERPDYEDRTAEGLQK